MQMCGIVWRETMVMVVACEVVPFDFERVMDEKSRRRKNLFRTYRTIEREQSGSSDCASLRLYP